MFIPLALPIIIEKIFLIAAQTSTPIKSFEIKNTHGGLTRKQTTFYKIHLTTRRSVQFTQNFSQFSYEENTNRNTLLAFYQIHDDFLLIIP